MLYMETLPTGERITRDAQEEDKISRNFEVSILMHIDS